MILQIDPAIPVYIPHLKECGLAHFLIDYSCEHNLKWIVFMDNSSEIWVFDNTKVRAQNNFTMGRMAGGKKQ